jgi:hypothetical protein
MDYMEDKERRGVQQEGAVFTVNAHFQDTNVSQVPVPIAQDEAVREGG